MYLFKLSKEYLWFFIDQSIIKNQNRTFSYKIKYKAIMLYEYNQDETI